MATDLLDLIFREGRSHSAWLDKPVDEQLLQDAYNLAKMGPTSVNCCPMRIGFIKSAEAKAKLKPCLQEGNIDKAMAAPVTAIIAYDLNFYDRLPELLPYKDVRLWFIGKDSFIQETAFRNGTLQGAYFLLAARAVGLDCGPMSGFDNAMVDKTFFEGTSLKSNFLCNLGYGDRSKLHARSPRLAFDEVCKIL